MVDCRVWTVSSLYKSFHLGKRPYFVESFLIISGEKSNFPEKVRCFVIFY